MLLWYFSNPRGTTASQSPSVICFQGKPTWLLKTILRDNNTERHTVWIKNAYQFLLTIFSQVLRLSFRYGTELHAVFTECDIWFWLLNTIFCPSPEAAKTKIKATWCFYFRWFPPCLCSFWKAGYGFRMCYQTWFCCLQSLPIRPSSAKVVGVGGMNAHCPQVMVTDIEQLLCLVPAIHNLHK